MLDEKLVENVDKTYFFMNIDKWTIHKFVSIMINDVKYMDIVFKKMDMTIVVWLIDGYKSMICTSFIIF